MPVSSPPCMAGFASKASPRRLRTSSLVRLESLVTPTAGLVALLVLGGIALAAVVPFVLFGAGALDFFMVSAGLAFVLPLMFLLAALLLLERETLRGDVLATCALVLSAFSDMIGLATLVAAATVLIWGDR